MNKYNDLDMSKPLNIQQNLKKSILVTTGSSVIGAIFFFIAYSVTDNVWLLAVGVILVVSGIAFMFVIQHIQNKYADLMENSSKIDNNQQ
ncbi:hypothetical protein MASR1M45_15180 [Candidatus Kapaibacterium sp.]